MLDAACESICCAKQASFFHSKHQQVVRVTGLHKHQCAPLALAAVAKLHTL